MKVYTSILVLLLFISCSSKSQTDKLDKKKDSVKQIVKIQAPKKFTSFKIDSIADINKNTNERSPDFIKQRLIKLIGNSYKKRCENIGIKYPPNYVLFRTFKLEKEYEIWVANSRSDTLKLLATLPICAVNSKPGTKLMQGDGKTPEGFYTCKILYGSSNGFMWIKLNNSEINNYGTTQYGSSFKLCIDYPLQIDRNRTHIFAGNVSAGSAICIHGNCVSAGCISFENKDFFPIFLSAKFHNTKKNGYPKVHIFPFRFTEELKNKKSKVAYSNMKPSDIINFWEDIEPAYQMFEKNHKAIKVSFLNNKYNFVEY